MKWFKKEKVYTEAEAVETIGEFLRTLGHEDYEEASKQFPHLLKRVKENYRQEIKSFEKQIERQEVRIRQLESLYDDDRDTRTSNNDIVFSKENAMKFIEETENDKTSKQKNRNK